MARRIADEGRVTVSERRSTVSFMLLYYPALIRPLEEAVMATIRSLALAAALVASSAMAQQYPTHAITMMVPFAPGPTDTVARVIAQSMAKPLGQSIVVENRPSAGGILAPELVKNAKPDGHTILIHHIGMATTPALYRQLRFNPLTDFEYIGLINDVPMTLLGRQNLPPKDFAELLDYIKKNKDKVSLANAGIGAASHLCGMLFMSAIQVDVLTVPYKGTGPAMNDLLGGQVDLLCDQTTNTTSQIKGGKVKAYGVTTKARVASLPELRTLDEQGLKGFEVSVWHALYAPKGTPKPALDKLVAALQEGLKDPTVKQRFADLGATTMPPDKGTPAALQSFLKSEIDKWAPLIKKAGVYAD
jgi:tripartite-type tricarboxylate transporter receptor subunit TctC